jgi:hypothetical protein
MSASILDLMKLVESTKVDASVYVYFDPTAGKIHKIGRKDDTLEKLSWILVHPEDVEPIMSGKKHVDEYKVSFDPDKKHYKLLERLSTIDDNVYNVLHEIPIKKTDVEKYYDVDLIISQNLKETCWKVKISSEIQKACQNGAFLYKNLLFSITAKHDPNILYRLLRVDFSSLVLNGYMVFPFEEKFEEVESDISIFTSKAFDSYIYEVVK